MKSFEVFLKNKKQISEMFNFSKKIDMVFIDKNDGNTIKTLGDAVKPSETIKPINDYIKESNPIASLGKDLNDKDLTFENFSDQDLGQIILFFLTKNLPKDIEDSVGAKGINKLNKTNSFLGMPNSFSGINWRQNSFLEGLFDKLPLYFSDPEKIKQIIHFVVKYFHESLTSKHVIKIIKSLHNDSVSYIVANFIHFDLFRKIKMKDFLALLKEKELEGVSSSYLSDLIKGYLERKSMNEIDLMHLGFFIGDYRRKHPEDPIKGHEELVKYHNGKHD